MQLLNKIDEYKTAIDQKRPFEGDMLNQLGDYYRIGLTWTSNALEGNTFDILDVKYLSRMRTLLS